MRGTKKPTLSVTYCALASVLQAARPNKSARFGTSSARSSAKRRVIKKEAQEERQPSPLFEQPSRRAPDTEHVGRRDIRRYATPMARRLVKVAAFLDAQLLLLQQGSDIDSRQLSRNADRLLMLHEEDREGLLFASRCLSLEPLLVRHGIAVAVHLLDLVGNNMPREVRKAIVASGLVHDLGKALIPQVVFKAPSFEATHRRALSEHVSLLLARLHTCQWLSATVAQASLVVSMSGLMVAVIQKG